MINHKMSCVKDTRIMPFGKMDNSCPRTCIAQKIFTNNSALFSSRVSLRFMTT